MKKLILTLGLLLVAAVTQAAPTQVVTFAPPAISVTPAQKAMFHERIFLSRISKDGYYKGIFLAGKVKVVDNFPDIKVKIVNHFPDLKVRRVDHFPDDIGEWQFVEYGEDFRIKFVEHFEDISIKFVDHFPGVG